jgi:hypothetical protein
MASRRFVAHLGISRHSPDSHQFHRHSALEVASARVLLPFVLLTDHELIFIRPARLGMIDRARQSLFALDPALAKKNFHRNSVTENE